MPHGDDFYIRNKKTLDSFTKIRKMFNMGLSKEENRLRRILGPFRNILPKISVEEIKKRVDEYIKSIPH